MSHVTSAVKRCELASEERYQPDEPSRWAPLLGLMQDVQQMLTCLHVHLASQRVQSQLSIGLLCSSIELQRVSMFLRRH